MQSTYPTQKKRGPWERNALFLAVFLMAAFVAHGQTKIQNFTTRDGLSHNCVYGTCVDPDNIMWIATEGGVSRFNGYDFKTYTMPGGISPSPVTAISSDRFGNIWAGGRFGIFVKPKRLDRFLFYRHLGDFSNMVVDFPYLYTVNVLGPLHTINVLTGQIQTQGYVEERFRYISPRKEGGAWLAVNDSIVALEGFSQTYWPIAGVGQKETHTGIYDAGDALLLIRGTHIVQISKTGHRITDSFPLGEYISPKNIQLSMDNHSRILCWKYFDNGTLKRITPTDQGYREEVLMVHTLPGPISNTGHLMLLSSYGKGLFVYPDNPFIKNLHFDRFNDYVISIYTDSLHTFFGTSNGLFELKDKRMSQIPMRSVYAGYIEYIRQVKPYKDGYAVAMVPSTGTSKNVQDGVPFYEIYGRCFTVNGDTLISPSMSDNLFGKLLFTGAGQAKSIDTVRFTKSAYRESFVKDIYHENGTYLLGTGEGLIVYSEKGPLPLTGNWFRHRSFYFIKKLENRIVMGTSDGILIGDTLNGIRLIKITDTDNEEYFALHQCPDGSLALGTNFGLVIYRNNKIAIIDENDGLSLQQVNAIAQTGDGKLLVGGNGGLYEIDSLPTLFEEARKGLECEFSHWQGNGRTSFNTKGSTVSITQVTNGKIVIRYNAINYTDPKNIWYRYRLNQGAWFETRAREAVFDDIAPDRYLFTVEASENRQEWGNAAMVSFTVTAYFWQTLWFRIAVVLLAVLLLLTAWILVRRQYRKQLKRFSLLSRYRIESLNASINSHFIYNILNSIRYYIYLEKNDQAGEMLDSFAQMIRSSVENSGHVFVPLNKELEHISSYVSVTRLRYEAPIELQVTNRLDGNPIVPFLLLQPFVENSIQHGYWNEQTPYIIKIVIDNLPGDRYFKIDIEDFGKRPGQTNTPNKDEGPSNKHSYAISNIRERLDFMYRQQGSFASLTLTDKTLEGGSGYLVEIILPHEISTKFLAIMSK